LDFLPYARVDRIGGARSVSEIIVDSEPQAGWLAPYRVTIIPRDSIGLQCDDLSSILELLGDVTIARLEIAFDFPLDSKVDVEFVERFALFGRSRSRHPRDETMYASYGSRVGAKYVRAYAREFLRIELELHSLDLRRLGITDMFQFHKLADLLPGRYIMFAKIDHAKLAKLLRRTGLNANERERIQNTVLQKEKNLSCALKYLRREVKLKSTRRLLIPLGINCVVQNALRDWAKHWPKKPFAPGEPG